MATAVTKHSIDWGKSSGPEFPPRIPGKGLEQGGWESGGGVAVSQVCRALTPPLHWWFSSWIRNLSLVCFALSDRVAFSLPWSWTYGIPDPITSASRVIQTCANMAAFSEKTCLACCRGARHNTRELQRDEGAELMRKTGEKERAGVNSPSQRLGWGGRGTRSSSLLTWANKTQYILKIKSTCH